MNGISRLERAAYADAPPTDAERLGILAVEIEVEREELRPKMGKAVRGVVHRDEVDRLSWEDLLLHRPHILERCQRAAPASAFIGLVLAHCDPVNRTALAWMHAYYSERENIAASTPRMVDALVGGMKAMREKFEADLLTSMSSRAASAAAARHASTNSAREWVRSEWLKYREEYGGNKSAFARDYVRRLQNERGVQVKEKTVREIWLSDTPSAGKTARLHADGE